MAGTMASPLWRRKKGNPKPGSFLVRLFIVAIICLLLVVLMHHPPPLCNDFYIHTATETEMAVNLVTSYVQPTTTKNTAAICAVAKHEAPYIDEWTDYNLGLGFAAIYVYDNSDRFEMEQWGQERRARGENVLVFHNPGWAVQGIAYYQCAKIAMEHGHEWAFFIDIDEFLVLKKDFHVANFAKTYIKDGALGINWRTFGSSKRQNYEPIPVTKRFQLRVPDTYRENQWLKSFVRLKDMDLSQPYISCHYFPLKNNTHQKNTDGKKFFGSLHSGPSDVAAIYHYRFKSREEFIFKGSRGDGHHGKRKIGEYVEKALAGKTHSGEPIPNGTIFDDTAWQNLKRMVPKYEMYDAF